MFKPKLFSAETVLVPVWAVMNILSSIWLFLGSMDYAHAVSEIKLFFPEGLCCKSNTDLLAEQVLY